MEVYDVVKKLVGKIDPVGETYEDERRFKNLEIHINLVEQLIDDLVSMAKYNKDRVEYSMKEAGEKAHNFLRDMDMAVKGETK